MDGKRVRAVVRVVLEVEADSVWSTDTTWEQISKQACDSVKGLLSSGNELALRSLWHRIKGMTMIEVKVRQEGE